MVNNQIFEGLLLAVALIAVAFYLHRRHNQNLVRQEVISVIQPTIQYPSHMMGKIFPHDEMNHTGISAVSNPMASIPRAVYIELTPQSVVNDEECPLQVESSLI